MILNSNNNSLTKTSVIVPLIFTLTTTTALSTELTTQSSHRINGKVNFGWLSDDMRAPKHDFISNISRVNLIGNIGLNDDLSIVYQYGSFMNLADQANQPFFNDHNQYIGLKGGYGELLYGRNDTMLKQSLGGADKFNDYVVDVFRLWKGENRIDDAFWYKSKPINGIQFGVTYQPDGGQQGNDAWSYMVGIGDKSLKKTDLYVALGIDRNLKGYDVERVTAKFNYQGFNIGASVQSQQHRSTGLGDSGILLNFAYPFKLNDANMGIDFQFQNLGSEKALSLGLSYFYQGKNKIYAWFSDVNQNQATTMNDDNIDNNIGKDNLIFSIGFEHWFDHKF